MNHAVHSSRKKRLRQLLHQLTNIIKGFKNRRRRSSRQSPRGGTQLKFVGAEEFGPAEDDQSQRQDAVQDPEDTSCDHDPHQAVAATIRQ